MSQSELGVIINSLTEAAYRGKHTEFTDPIGFPVYNFYLPNRPDIKQLLDPDHLPAVTRFETVVILPGLAELRGVPASNFPGIIKTFPLPFQTNWLETLSGVAKRKTGYDREKGFSERTHYLQAMRDAMAFLRRKIPDIDGFAGIPVKRAGANIAGALGLDLSLAIEAKRLRLKDSPDTLAIGVNLPDTISEGIGNNQGVAFIEGCLASGSTEIGGILALENRGIHVPRASCLSVFACPAGGEYVNRMRGILKIGGEDASVFPLGELNRDWYVVYGKDDLARPELSDMVRRLQLQPGDQVGGDAGDFTSL